VIEALTVAALKEFAKKLWAWCKKYWQLLAGMSIGIILFLLSSDRSGMKKTLQKFKESSEEERKRSLEIDREKQSKVDKVIDKFEKDIKSAAESLVERDEKIDAAKSDEVTELLDKEEESRGSIASEIQKKLGEI